MVLPRPLRGTRQMVLRIFPALLALTAGGPASAIEMRTGNLVLADRSADPMNFGDYRGSLLLVDEASQSPVQLIATPEGFRDPVAIGLLTDGRILVVDENADFLEDRENRGVIWVVDPTANLPGRALPFAWSEEWVNPCDILLETAGHVLVLDSDADPLGTGTRPGALYRVRHPTRQVDAVASSAFWIKPSSMTYDLDGKVLVWDSRADPLGYGTYPGALFRVDPATGIVEFVFSMQAFQTPEAIGIDADGNYLILDRDANPSGYTGAPGGIYRIERTDLTLTPLLFLPSFVDPSDFLVDPSGDLWICDQRANPCGFPSAHGAVFRCDPLTGAIKKTICSGFFRDLAGISQFAGSALDSSKVAWEDLSGPPLQAGDRMRVRVRARNTGNVPGRPVVLEHELGPEWDYRIGSDSVSQGLFSYDPAWRTATWSGDLDVQGEALISYEIRLNDDVVSGTVLKEDLIFRIAQVGSPFSLEATTASRFDLDRFVWADNQPTGGTTRGRILTMAPGAIYPSVIFEGPPLVLPDDVVMLDDGTIAVLDRRSRPLGPDQPPGGIYRIDPLDGTIDTLFAVGEHPELRFPVGLANGRIGELLLVDKDANPLGFSGQPGAVYSIDVETGALEPIASDPRFSEPSDVILETTGKLLVIDYNADPFGGGPNGGGALFEVNRLSGSVRLVYVPRGTFVDPIGLAEGPNRKVYVADISADPRHLGGNTGAIFEVLRGADNLVVVASADRLYADPTDLFVTSGGELIITDREGNPFGMPRDWGAVYRAVPREPPSIVTADQTLYGPEAIAGIVRGDLSTSSIAVTDLNGVPSLWGDTLRFEAVIPNSGRASIAEAMATLFVSPKLSIVGAEGSGEVVAEPEAGAAFWFGSIGVGDTVRVAVEARLEGEFTFGESAFGVLDLAGPGAGDADSAGVRVVASLGKGDMILVDLNADPNHTGEGNGALFLIREKRGVVEQVLHTDPAFVDPSAVEGLGTGRVLVADKQGGEPGVIFAVDYMMATSEVYLEDDRLGSPSDLLWTRDGDLVIVDPLATIDLQENIPVVFIQRSGEEQLSILCADPVLEMPSQVAEDDLGRLWLVDRLADPNGPDEKGKGALLRIDPQTGSILEVWQFPEFEAPVGVVPWTGEGLLIVDEVATVGTLEGNGLVFLCNPDEGTCVVKITDPRFRQLRGAALSPGDLLWIIDRVARNESLPGNPRTLFRWNPGTNRVEMVASSTEYASVGEIYAFPGPRPRVGYYTCEDANGPPLNPDDELIFRVRLENIGPVGTEQATFSDTLPVQVQLDESSVRADGGIIEFHGRVNGLYWTVDLPSEGSAELRYRARIHRGTQQGTEFKFRSHLRTQEGAHRVGQAKALVFVYYEDGNLYLADEDSDPYELGGHHGTVWKVLLDNGLAVPMISSPMLESPTQVALMPNADQELLIVDSDANPRGYARGRGCLWRWNPATGEIEELAADSTFRSPCCVLPISSREVLLLDVLADPFDLTRAVGPGAVYRIDVESGDVEPFASDTILSAPVSMVLDQAGGAFVLDREADPNRFGLRNGAVFRLDLAKRTFSVYAASADFRGPVAGVVASDGYLYVLDRDVQIFPGGDARGAIYRIDEMGNVSFVIASRQFRRPTGFVIDPRGRMIVSDSAADPRNRGTDTGALFRRMNLESDFRVFSSSAGFVNPQGFFVRDDSTPVESTDLEATPEEEGIRIGWRVGEAHFDGFFCMRADGIEPEQEQYEILNPDDLISGRGPWEYLDRAVSPDATYSYQVLGILPGGSQRFFGPVVATATALRRFALLPPAPNPIRGTTTIAFDLPAEGSVDLNIFDFSGRRVRSLVGQVLPAGRHTIVWDGRNDSGHRIASGIFLVRLAWSDRTADGRLVLLR